MVFIHHTYTLLNNYESLQAIYRPVLKVSNRLLQVCNTYTPATTKALCEMFCSFSIFRLYFNIFTLMGADFTCLILNLEKIR